ncbi:MAG TPA: bifunctional 5,10-methylenetetrahydrofolate dehydrogenase/5,10-methenyltetrahydrofolate cyclohydrolase [Gaiellaceae bacterium]|jgi:methylenetetrahydrofolate dehydrogenase (NADP+)/methenyltetrahydrofolate cyclohydrolase|nr:bifunctional 5,10-methylenetetrahydrofolate dehydrogenase/5,10-methenyltetrahydrofolate cyclohydrolase [Gaiellaceae bacterium]
MPAQLMDGKALAERIRREVAEEVEQLGEVGLTTILVGDDPASEIYIRRKQEAAKEVGILARDYRLAEETTEEELLDLITQLNADDKVDGILLQLPLPDQIDEQRAIEAVDPAKDVDGFHPLNAGRLWLGLDGLVAGTPTGIITLLDEYGVPLEGAHAVVVGRSNIVGKPVALLLLARNATVTICHSRTADLAAETRQADVLVVAVGEAGLISPEMVKEGATVVDVGMNRTDEGLRGDVDPAVAERAGLITPVPGGVGPMTIASLLRNTVKAARARRC